MLSNRKPCDILTWQSLKSLLLHMPPPSRQPKFNDKVALVIVPLKGISASKGKMDSKKSNKITEIVRLQQILKKWRKLANTSKSSGNSSSIKNSNNNNSNKGKLLRRTLSLSEKSDVVPKEAEEEFGFQQAGVLRIPCEVSAFENILKVVKKKDFRFLGEDAIGCCSSESQLNQSYHPQSPMCT
ncbi:hypothetical protein CK203_069138 [Vitis vinifera]|uniref:Auxin-responsive protein SAUR72 n=1 Tax=Vitis vinifera TaxID=29760 RepID=A0A438C268_VITVI|nr:hypothetical protein CK203_069138 [Vitis vinifera]